MSDWISPDWAGQRVLVTGGTGFLGRHVVRLLTQRGADAVAVGRADADLTSAEEVRDLFQRARPQTVIHCAVDGGGIGWMRDHPVESGENNALINIHTLRAARECGAMCFIGVSSACAYPRLCPVPFVEADLWNGYPEPTNGPYALSKRLMMDLGRAYHRQYGFRAVFPILANLYGPGDHLDPERSHVVAALLQRCLRLGPDDELVVWGTGRATREFLYVEDAADGVLAMADCDSPEPVNIGSGVEVPIADLAAAVARACGFTGAVRCDPTRPDGQPRKCLDVRRAQERLGWSAKTPLDVGLVKTATWYRSALSASR